jgi:undecaprenyl-diphosphatase
MTRALQRALPHDGAPATVVALLGDAGRLLPLAVILLACLQRRWSAALFVAVAYLSAAALAEWAVTPLVARPRPSASLVHVYRQDRGYGFPSGSALVSVVLVGSVAHLLRGSRRPGERVRPRPAERVALGAGCLLVLLIALSRVYVGAHWATDVVGGWLLGAAWLLLLIAAHGRWPGKRRERRPAR